jgi:hypothetical protein
VRAVAAAAGVPLPRRHLGEPGPQAGECARRKSPRAALNSCSASRLGR